MKKVLSIFLLTLFFISCSKEDPIISLTNSPSDIKVQITDKGSNTAIITGKVIGEKEGTTITIIDCNKKSYTTKTNSNGVFEIPVKLYDEECKLTIVAKASGKKDSKAITINLQAKNTVLTASPENLVVEIKDNNTNAIISGSIPEEGAGVKIVITDCKGKEISGTTLLDGSFSIEVEIYDEDCEASIVALAKDKSTSKKITVTIPKKISNKTTTPFVSKIIGKDGDSTRYIISGSIPEEGAGVEIEISDCRGEKIFGITINDGSFTIEVEGYDEDCEASIVATAKDKLPSQKTTITIPKKIVKKTATPTNLKVEVKPGEDTKFIITGKIVEAKAGVKIVITDCENKDTIGLTDNDGSFTIEIDGYDKLCDATIVATAENQNPSDKSPKITIPKIDRKGKSIPAHNVYVSRNPNWLSDVNIEGNLTIENFDGKEGEILSNYEIIVIDCNGTEHKGGKVRYKKAMGVFWIEMKITITNKTDCKLQVIVLEKGKDRSDPVEITIKGY